MKADMEDFRNEAIVTESALEANADIFLGLSKTASDPERS